MNTPSKISYQSSLNARTIEKYGITRDEWKAIGTEARNLYRQNRNYAAKILVPWELTLGQWWKIWQDSGKWEERGRGTGYGLTRIDTTKPFSVDNVVIETAQESMRHRRLAGTGAKNGSRAGIYLTFPGIRKGWIARHAGKHLGYFESEELATQAKQEYINNNNNKKVSPHEQPKIRRRTSKNS